MHLNISSNYFDKSFVISQMTRLEIHNWYLNTFDLKKKDFENKISMCLEMLRDSKKTLGNIIIVLHDIGYKCSIDNSIIIQLVLLKSSALLVFAIQWTFCIRYLTLEKYSVMHIKGAFYYIWNLIMVDRTLYKLHEFWREIGESERELV